MQYFLKVDIIIKLRKHIYIYYDSFNKFSLTLILLIFLHVNILYIYSDATECK